MAKKLIKTTVAGQEYEVFNQMKRNAHGSFARNVKTEEVRQISFGGYMRADLPIRKAIAKAFELPSFRK